MERHEPQLPNIVVTVLVEALNLPEFVAFFRVFFLQVTHHFFFNHLLFVFLHELLESMFVLEAEVDFDFVHVCLLEVFEEVIDVRLCEELGGFKGLGLEQGPLFRVVHLCVILC
jgi:hypothetical protein